MPKAIDDDNSSGKSKIIVYAAYATIILLIIGVLTYFGITGDIIFKMDKGHQEVYNVESHNQSGGITAGKIESVTINNSADVHTNPEDFKKLVIIEEKINHDNNTGLYKHTLVFGSYYSIFLTNIHIKLQFDSEYSNVNSFIKGPNAQRGMYYFNMSEDKKSYEHSEDFLKSGNYLFFEFISQKPLKIDCVELYP